MKEYQKHNNIHSEIKSLSSKLSWFYKLNNHEKDEAINNTLLKLLDKEKENKIKLDNFAEYKGYMFLTLKNAIARQLNNRKINKRFQKPEMSIELNDNYSIITPYYGEIDTLALITLSPLNKAIYRFIYKRGWTHKQMGDAIGRSESGIYHRLRKIRKQLLLSIK